MVQVGSLGRIGGCLPSYEVPLGSKANVARLKREIGKRACEYHTAFKPWREMARSESAAKIGCVASGRHAPESSKGLLATPNRLEDFMTQDWTRRGIASTLGAAGLLLVGSSTNGSAAAKEDARSAVAFHDFYDGKLPWYTLDGFDNISYHVLEVNERLRSVDLLFKFAADKKIGLHRHMAPYRTLVLQGELRIYRPNGELKDVRPTGSYVAGEANGEPHTEGGGDIDAIVYFTNREVGDVIYENMDEKFNITSTFGPKDFKSLLLAQKTTLTR